MIEIVFTVFFISWLHVAYLIGYEKGKIAVNKEIKRNCVELLERKRKF